MLNHAQNAADVRVHHPPAAAFLALISHLHVPHAHLRPPVHREPSYMEMARMSREMGHS